MRLRILDWLHDSRWPHRWIPASWCKYYAEVKWRAHTDYLDIDYADGPPPQ